MLVCRLWPSSLFAGLREAEAEAAAVEGMDLWYDPTTGSFLRETDMEVTDNATVDPVRAEGREEAYEAECGPSTGRAARAEHTASAPG